MCWYIWYETWRRYTNLFVCRLCRYSSASMHMHEMHVLVYSQLKSTFPSFNYVSVYTYLTAFRYPCVWMNVCASMYLWVFMCVCVCYVRIYQHPCVTRFSPIGHCNNQAWVWVGVEGVRPVRLDSQSCLTARLTSAKPNYLFPSELHVCVCPPAWKRSSSHFFCVSFLWIFLVALVYVFFLLVFKWSGTGNDWNNVWFWVLSQQEIQIFSIYLISFDL